VLLADPLQSNLHPPYVPTQVSWISEGTTIIDVGINRITTKDSKTKLIGDVAFEEVLGKAAKITPVPGGVGPVTIACLLHNTLQAARNTIK